MDAFGLFTGQVGWAWNNTLLYVKGGAAVTDNRHDIITDATGAVFGRSGDDTRWGAVVGAGLEFGFAPNWSAGVEYDHIFMGDRNATFTDPATGALRCSRSDQRRCRPRHGSRELPLGRPGDRALLIALCRKGIPNLEKAGLAPAFSFVPRPVHGSPATRPATNR